MIWKLSKVQKETTPKNVKLRVNDWINLWDIDGAGEAGNMRIQLWTQLRGFYALSNYAPSNLNICTLVFILLFNSFLSAWLALRDEWASARRKIRRIDFFPLSFPGWICSRDELSAEREFQTGEDCLLVRRSRSAAPYGLYSKLAVIYLRMSSPKAPTPTKIVFSYATYCKIHAARSKTTVLSYLVTASLHSTHLICVDTDKWYVKRQAHHLVVRESTRKVNYPYVMFPMWCSLYY